MEVTCCTRNTTFGDEDPRNPIETLPNPKKAIKSSKNYFKNHPYTILKPSSLPASKKKHPNYPQNTKFMKPNTKKHLIETKEHRKWATSKMNCLAHYYHYRIFIKRYNMYTLFPLFIKFHWEKFHISFLYKRREVSCLY
jgi:hypothetical protein